MEPKQVTVGFKVSANLKKRIEQVASQSGMDVSNYLRGLLLKRHNKISALCDYPNELVFDTEATQQILDLISELQSSHVDVSVPSILIATLKLAKENENRIISNKLQKYL